MKLQQRLDKILMIELSHYPTIVKHYKEEYGTEGNNGKLS